MTKLHILCVNFIFRMNYNWYMCENISSGMFKGEQTSSVILKKGWLTCTPADLGWDQSGEVDRHWRSSNVSGFLKRKYWLYKDDAAISVACTPRTERYNETRKSTSACKDKWQMFTFAAIHVHRRKGCLIPRHCLTDTEGGTVGNLMKPPLRQEKMNVLEHVLSWHVSAVYKNKCWDSNSRACNRKFTNQTTPVSTTFTALGLLRAAAKRQINTIETCKEIQKIQKISHSAIRVTSKLEAFSSHFRAWS